jgi:hypothetical protein
LGIEASENALRRALVHGFAQVLAASFSRAQPEAAELEQAAARVELHRADFLAAPSSKSV